MSNISAPRPGAIQERHLSQPAGRIALILALVDDGEPLTPRQQTEVDGWKRIVGESQICAYDPESRDGWWIVPRDRGETGWFRFPAS